jgi:Protein of unknown function (DUF4238)
MEKISNHYVPQFYLRNFSSDKKSIGIYNLKNNKYVKEASIKKQACKDYLYGDDGKIEDMFMKIESQVAGIIKNISETQKIPSKQNKDFHALLHFMLLSEARNLKTADSFNNFVNMQMKTLLRMKTEHGTVTDLSPEFLEETDIRADIPNLMSIKVTTEVYPILLDLKCCLIVNTTDRHFITSDNPLVRYNQMYIKRRYHLRGYGFGNMGIQLFFPITPSLCICIFDDVFYNHKENEQGNIIVNKGRYVDELNKLFYLNSYKTVFFNGKISEAYIRRIAGSAIHSSSEINKEVTVLGSNDRKFIHYSQKKVDKTINLAMFNINRDFVNMPLPSHMGGPMRPYALEFIEKEKNKRGNNKAMSKV